MAHLLYKHDVHIAFVKVIITGKIKRAAFKETICIASAQPVDINNLPNLPRIDYHQDRF